MFHLLLYNTDFITIACVIDSSTSIGAFMHNFRIIFIADNYCNVTTIHDVYTVYIG